MKKPEWRLGKAFTIATVTYLVCSIFGCLLYMVLPPFFSSTGARIHAYFLLITTFDPSEHLWLTVLTVVAHLYVLAQVIFGFLGLKTGKLKVFTLLTMVEIGFTLAFLVVQDAINNEYVSGILLNTAYCAWLLKKVAPQKKNETQKGNCIDGKL